MPRWVWRLRSELDGLGQKYYIQAVRLADEADDPLMRATVLRSLTVQAISRPSGCDQRSRLVGASIWAMTCSVRRARPSGWTSRGVAGEEHCGGREGVIPAVLADRGEEQVHRGDGVLLGCGSVRLGG
ncbi:MAG: hypothetical protein ACRDTT_25300 [Pseudonocardiaceae bacterium]